MTPVRKPFLTAEWLNLAVLNYEIDAAVLEPYVPAGTELDLWQDQALVSIVGFEFRDTRVRGIAIPFHRDFEEVNLRFYIRRPTDDGWRRGVCFLRELVPRAAVSWVARHLYGENYATVPMRHHCIEPSESPGAYEVDYHWRWSGSDCHLHVRADHGGEVAQPGTLDEFIIEHYWGYSGGLGRTTVEYQVEHPPWKLWPASEANFSANVAALYGAPFAAPLSAPPVSAFIAAGSKVAVFPGHKIQPSQIPKPHLAQRAALSTAT